MKTLSKKVFGFCHTAKENARRAFALVFKDKFLLFLSVSLFAVVIFSLPLPSIASSTVDDVLYQVTSIDSILGFVVRLLFIIAYVLGWLVHQLFSVVVGLASFNDFFKMQAVTRGWVVVRDVVNLSFVFILLFIAISEILHLGKYSAKQTVPKVLAAAVLVNFSKLLCGLVIDFTQVVMITFVAGFRETAGGNLVVGLGLDKMLDTELAKDTTTGETLGWDSFAQVLSGVALAVFLLLMVLVVVFFMAALLALRIVILLFLVILSPFAFVFALVPISSRFSGKASQWWEAFINYASMGPMMAFFLWLSLLMMSQGEEMLGGAKMGELEAAAGIGGPVMGYLDNMMMFAVGLSMLVASLLVAVETGGYAAQLGNMGINAMKKTAKKFAGAVGTATGAGFVYNRGAAMAGGFMSSRAAVKKARMEEIQSKYGSLGGAAFSKYKKVVDTPANLGRGLINNVAGGAAGAVAGAGTTLGTVGAVLGGKKTLGAAGKDVWASMAKNFSAFKDRSRTITNDNAGKSVVNKEQEARFKGARDQAVQDLTLNGLYEDKEKRREVLDSAAFSSVQKQAVLMESAKEGELNKADVANAKKAFGDDETGFKEFLKELMKTQAHLAYDVNDEKGKEKLTADIQSGEFDLTKLSAENLKQIAETDPKFMQVAMDVRGDNFAEDMKKLSGRSDAHKQEVAKLLENTIQDLNVRAQKAAPAKNASTADKAKYNQESLPAKAMLEKGSVQRLFADLTGDITKAFATRDANGSIKKEQIQSPPSSPGGPTAFKTVDLLDDEALSALSAYIAKAKGAQLGKISFKVDENVKVKIANQFTPAKLSAMAKSNDSGAIANMNTVLQTWLDQQTKLKSSTEPTDIATLAEIENNLREIVANNNIMDNIEDVGVKRALRTMTASAPAPAPAQNSSESNQSDNSKPFI